jgi:hypothetical protein
MDEYDMQDAIGIYENYTDIVWESRKIELSPITEMSEHARVVLLELIHYSFLEGYKDCEENP